MRPPVLIPFALGALLLATGAVAAEGPPIDRAQAASLFATAKAICAADAGRLWGASLCGPIMLVEPQSRAIVASQADAGHVLNAADGVFTGVLPPRENIAFTAVDWSGTRWVQLRWPLPQGAEVQRVLIAHESYHRIQPQIGLPIVEGGDNRHLDELEGRYLLLLEWRALARGLTAKTAAARRAAIVDALTFRARRYALFPKAAADERALERNEGLAEYTGLRAGLATPAARTAYALGDLKDRAGDPSFTRAFALATGPAMGLLLDGADPAWRRKAKAGQAMDQLLAKAVRFVSPADLAATVKARAGAYDQGGALREAEETRATARQAMLAQFRVRLAQGPVLKAPLAKPNYSFDPRTLQPLDELGTVYPAIRLTDDWGVLEVETGGALMG
ncbi:MAG: hypothetical protein JSS35_20250, partial [Proteobacteria bacterium]|nr:hypothetical protein [Pseudomonadota bacterium]